MLHSIGILLLTTSAHATGADGPGAQGPGPERVTPERVSEVRAALDEAVRSRDAARIAAALATAQGVPHRDVVADVRETLEDEREEVRLAALQSLRWLAHPDALAALEELAKDSKRMRSPPFAAAVLRGLGQHADPGSVALIARTPFEPADHACVSARVLALGRVRSFESLEALMGMLGATHGARGERRLQGHMRDVRTSLVLLTGLDHGAAPEAWERWWRDNRRTFRVPADPPPLPKELRQRWNAYWGLSHVNAREPRREDRGRDPPR